MIASCSLGKKRKKEEKEIRKYKYRASIEGSVKLAKQPEIIVQWVYYLKRKLAASGI